MQKKGERKLQNIIQTDKKQENREHKLNFVDLVFSSEKTPAQSPQAKSFQF